MIFRSFSDLINLFGTTSICPCLGTYLCFGNLENFKKFLEKIEIAVMETLFSEVNSFIESKGFSLIDLKRYFWKRKSKNDSNRKGQLVFADALYFKEPENSKLIRFFGDGRPLESEKELIQRKQNYSNIGAVLIFIISPLTLILLGIIKSFGKKDFKKNSK